MNRIRIRRLAINRETLRRLVADDLQFVAGGRGGCCTFGNSGCHGTPETNVCLPGVGVTAKCDSNACQ